MIWAGRIFHFSLFCLFLNPPQNLLIYFFIMFIGPRIHGTGDVGGFWQKTLLFSSLVARQLSYIMHWPPSVLAPPSTHRGCRPMCMFGDTPETSLLFILHCKQGFLFVSSFRLAHLFSRMEPYGSLSRHGVGSWPFRYCPFVRYS